MRKKRVIALASMALFVAAACVTVNIYFPAAEVQKAADEIVGDVRGQISDETQKQDRSPAEGAEKESWLHRILPEHGIFQKPAYAAMDIEVTTPAIRSLKGSLKERFAQLKPFYEAGRIGETNKGTVATRDLDGLGLKEKSVLLRLVDEENKDRNALYMEILSANKLGAEHLGEVERIFANSWRKDAPKGWWIQKDDGTWVRKQ